MACLAHEASRSPKSTQLCYIGKGLTRPDQARYAAPFRWTRETTGTVRLQPDLGPRR
jgi:hypothetical protein